jgi:hypothetical protein
MLAGMNISTLFGEFIKTYETTVTVIILAVVLSAQIVLVYGMTKHHVPYNNNINNDLIILYVLLQSSIISSIEVSLVSSHFTAIITFLLCHFTMLWFVFLNMGERYISTFVVMSLMSYLVINILKKFWCRYSYPRDIWFLP